MHGRSRIAATELSLQKGKTRVRAITISRSVLH